MIVTRRNGLEFYQFASLAASAHLDHAVFTRRGGVSAPPFDSLNLGLETGDAPQNVKHNLELISGCFDHDRLIFLKQVHGDTIRVFSPDRPPGPPEEIQPGDAMISNIPGLLLGVRLADCQSVLLFDPIKKVTANIHSGWRGSVANIIGRTVTAMKNEFNCRTDDIKAGISPSLGPCCAEFVNYQREIPGHLWLYKDRRDHFDFWKISRDQLTAAGLQPENIETAAVCTRCRSDLFFSYRRKGQTGRFVTVAGIKKG